MLTQVYEQFVQSGSRSPEKVMVYREPAGGLRVYCTAVQSADPNFEPCTQVLTSGLRISANELNEFLLAWLRSRGFLE